MKALGEISGGKGGAMGKEVLEEVANFIRAARRPCFQQTRDLCVLLCPVADLSLPGSLSGHLVTG